MRARRAHGLGSTRQSRAVKRMRRSSPGAAKGGVARRQRGGEGCAVGEARPGWFRTATVGLGQDLVEWL